MERRDSIVSYMMCVNTTKICFVFAVILHVTIAAFLLVKFNNSRPVGLGGLTPTNNVINAIAVSEYGAKIAPKGAMLLTKQTKPMQSKLQKNNLLQEALEKNLLLEQAKEKAELKKEKQKYQKMAKQQQQQKMLKMLENQVAVEQKQLMQDRANVNVQNDDKAESVGLMAPSSGEINKYKSMVIQAISSQWNYSGNADEMASGQLIINITSTGEVLSVQLISSSGNLILDRSAQAAVLKASPLPVPEDPKLFDALIKMTFTRYGFV